MNALQADELLLTQRQRQWVAIGCAAVRRDRRLLRICEPPIRTDTAKEVAAQRARSGLSLGPASPPKPITGIALCAAARNPAEAERSTVPLLGRRPAGSGALPERGGTLPKRSGALPER
jgi:hypothetical protein